MVITWTLGSVLMLCSLVGEIRSVNCITNNGVIYSCSGKESVKAVGLVDGWSSGDLLIPKKVKDWYVCSVGDSAFADNPVLRSVRIEDGITSIGNKAFRGCNGLVKVNLPETLTWIGDEAFRDCSRIKEVRLPGHLDCDSSCVFRGCDSLTRLTIADGLACNIVPMLYGCTGLCEFDVGKNKMYRVVDGCLYDSTGQVFIRCPANFRGPDFCIRDGVKSIAYSAFLGCKGVKSVRLPPGLEEICSAAFGYSGIESVELPEGVSYIGMEAFGGCTNLNSVVIPRSIRCIEMYCFVESKGLRRIVFKGDRPKIFNPEYPIGAKDCVLMVPKGASGWDDKEQLWGLSVRFYDEQSDISRFDKIGTM